LNWLAVIQAMPKAMSATAEIRLRLTSSGVDYGALNIQRSTFNTQHPNPLKVECSKLDVES
jgi:hypothetical protein